MRVALLLRRRKAIISISSIIPISVTLLLSPLSLVPLTLTSPRWLLLLLLLLTPSGRRCCRGGGIHGAVRRRPLRREPDGRLSGHRRGTTGRGSVGFGLLSIRGFRVIAAALPVRSGGRGGETLMLIVHLLQSLDLSSVFFEEFQTTLVVGKTKRQYENLD